MYMNNLEMNSNEDVATVENQYWVDMWEALERLQNGNPQPKDFKKVILDGYFKDKAINGVSMLANQHIIEKGVRSQVMEDLVAVSKLQDYFLTIEALGNIPDDEEEEEEGV